MATERLYPAAAAPVFDADALRARVAGDESLLLIVVETFVDDAPRKLAALREAVSLGLRPRIVQLAHSLRGAAASAAASEMLTLATELQRSAEDAELPALEARLAALDAALQRFAAAACI